MVAFLFSIIVLMAGVGIIVFQMRRRPIDAPLTWGEALVAATFVFFLMFLAYGVIPHQWLNWADSELKWRKDAIGIPVGPLPIGGSDHTIFDNGIPLPNGEFIITKEAIRDVIVTLIYVVFLAAQIALFAIWQNRGKEKPIELPTSQYGRPLVRKS